MEIDPKPIPSRKSICAIFIKELSRTFSWLQSPLGVCKSNFWFGSFFVWADIRDPFQRGVFVACVPLCLAPQQTIFSTSFLYDSHRTHPASDPTHLLCETLSRISFLIVAASGASVRPFHTCHTYPMARDVNWYLCVGHSDGFKVSGLWGSTREFIKRDNFTTQPKKEYY